MTTTTANPAAETGLPETEIQRLYRTSRSATDGCRTCSGDDFQRHYAAADEAETILMGTRPTSLVDYALKTIVADNDGDANLTIFQREMVREAHQIAGVPGWTEEDEADLQDWHADVEAKRAARAAE